MNASHGRCAFAALKLHGTRVVTRLRRTKSRVAGGGNAPTARSRGVDGGLCAVAGGTLNCVGSKQAAADRCDWLLATAVPDPRRASTFTKSMS